MTRTPTLSDLRTQWRDGSLTAGDVEWLIDEAERLSGGQSHHHVMEKARAEIDRLTAELANCRQIIHEQYLRGEQIDRLVAERNAARKERDSAMESAENFRTMLRGAIKRAEKAEADNAALRATMLSEEERVSISVCMSEVVGSDIPDHDYVAVCRWLSRLSPPSAPAQDKEIDHG